MRSPQHFDGVIVSSYLGCVGTRGLLHSVHHSLISFFISLDVDCVGTHSENSPIPISCADTASQPESQSKLTEQRNRNMEVHSECLSPSFRLGCESYVSLNGRKNNSNEEQLIIRRPMAGWMLEMSGMESQLNVCMYIGNRK